MAPKVLIAEDDPLQRRTVRRMVEVAGLPDILEATDGGDAFLQLKNPPPGGIALVLLDLDMPVMDGMTLLKQRQRIAPDTLFIVLTGSERLEDAVQAMQLGAVDFITKPPQPERLAATVRNALALRNLQKEVTQLRQDRHPRYHFNDIADITPGLNDAIALGRKAAEAEIPILLTGESGVGKEVFAHAIHLDSPRRNAPFIAVNCGALPENLVESTLFGHEKGAFTGATSRSLGKCREADGGVLFLDEVGELKPDTQVKLLRLLQEGEIEPVGASKPVKVDLRIVSATNRPLEEMVAQGRFREDLYYRLHGLPIHLPPLRERRRDILHLAEHLLQRLARTEQRPSLTLLPDAQAWLSSHPWPGNVRELQHVLSRAVLLTQDGSISADHLARWAPARGGAYPKSAADSPQDVIFLNGPDGRLKSLEQIQREAVAAALARYNAHVGQAAAALGVGQSTLYKWMRK